MQDSGRASRFSRQVLVLFGTQVIGAGVGIINGILLARFLGPALKGDYTFIILLPASAIVLVQLGLPQAFGYFAARAQLRTILTRAAILTFALSAIAIGGILALMPALQNSIPDGITAMQLVLACIALPFALNVTFTTGIVMGRQAVRWYAGINILYPIATTALLAIVLGIFGPSVDGALVVYLLATMIQSIGFAVAAVRVSRSHESPEPVSFRDLFGYGLPSYPASLAGFFSYRVDVFVIAFLLADPSAAIGYYSLAVGLAEMVFFFPRAVWTMFFPHVAGAPRHESDRQVALASRVTLLLTAVLAVLLIPAAAILIWLLLPDFTSSFEPFLVLLPGVVALSASNVVGGYIMGIGRPGIPSSINVVALVLNLVANVLLVPRFGIVGAAAASLISYTWSAVALTMFAARFSGASVSAFWLVRASDARFALRTIARLVDRARDGARVAVGLGGGRR
jgi:O-antigen/teichoic acid export membrane protein